jgi:hypothetical protein
MLLRGACLLSSSCLQDAYACGTSLVDARVHVPPACQAGLLLRRACAPEECALHPHAVFGHYGRGHRCVGVCSIAIYGTQQGWTRTLLPLG